MLSSSIRNRMLTSRNLRKCALVCPLTFNICNFFRSCAAIVLVSTGTQLMYRWFSRYVIAAMLVDGKQKIAH